MSQKNQKNQKRPTHAVNSSQRHTKQPSPQSQNRARGGSHVRSRKVRYDRIAVVAVPLFLIIVLIVALCLFSCDSNHAETEDSASSDLGMNVDSIGESSSDEASETSVATDTTSMESGGSEITLSAEGVKKGNLIVINAEHSYTFPEGDPALVTVYEARNSSYRVSDLEVQLDEETVEQLNAMMEAFEAETGCSSLEIYSGYEESDGNGYTDFNSGRTFNLKINFDSSTSDRYNAEKYPDYSWISEHAAEYGFILRYPEGKEEITGEDSRTYTFRYVGVPHALYITEHDLCLEEYVELIKAYSAEEPLSIAVDDVTYSVYYVSIGGTNDVRTTVSGTNYAVSGDNIGGYIITCW